MSGQRLWDDVDGYIVDTFGLDDDVLQAALEDSAAAGLPAINVAPNQGALLMVLTQAIGARSVLEIGTLGGYSTIWLARGLPAGGRLISLELESAYAEVARRNIARAGLEAEVDVRVGPAIDTLSTLEPPFDLVFIDADKDGYPAYLEAVLDLVRPGSLIVADNVVREGDVVDATSDDPRVQGVRRYNELVAAHPRLRATAVQTVGTKGHDGFALALVT